MVRGTVRSLRVSIETDETALQIRRTIPPLAAPSRPRLHTFQELGAREAPDVGSPLTLIASPERTPAALSIPSIDQCLFFASDDSRPSAKSYRERVTLVGLASTVVELDDEIWQFERTPMAIIARRERHGYALVGRAYLLRELSSGRHADGGRQGEVVSSKLENRLV